MMANTTIPSGFRGSIITSGWDDRAIVGDNATVVGNVNFGTGNDVLTSGENVLYEGAINGNSPAGSTQHGEAVTLGQGTTVTGGLNLGSANGQGTSVGGTSSLTFIGGGVSAGNLNMVNTSVGGGVSTGSGRGFNGRVTLEDVTLGGGVSTSDGSDIVRITGDSDIGGDINLGNTGNDNLYIGGDVSVDGNIRGNGEAGSTQHQDRVVIEEGATITGGVLLGGDNVALTEIGGANELTNIGGAMQAANVSIVNTSIAGGGLNAVANGYESGRVYLEDTTLNGGVSFGGNTDRITLEGDTSLAGGINFGVGNDVLIAGDSVTIGGDIVGSSQAGTTQHNEGVTIGKGSSVGGDINLGGNNSASFQLGGFGAVTTVDGNITAGYRVNLTEVSVSGNVNAQSDVRGAGYSDQVTISNNSTIGAGSLGVVEAGRGTDTLFLQKGAIVASDAGAVQGQVTIGVSDASLVNLVLNGDSTWDVTLADDSGVPGSGDVFVASNFEVASTFVCFTSGTMIETSEGDVSVEELAPGDLVNTYDNGFQEVRWIRTKCFDRAQILANPNLAPVRIRKGALGAGLPERDLLVSQQHRMFISNRIAERVLGTREALIGAKQLVAIDGIDIVHDAENVEYVHFLCAQHELVYAEGTLSETLFTGPEALKSLPQASVEEIFTLFPELAEHARTGVMPTPARPFAKAKMARRMAQRIQKNGAAALEFNA